jgi:hypothetical protein
MLVAACSWGCCFYRIGPRPTLLLVHYSLADPVTGDDGADASHEECAKEVEYGR